MTDHRFLIGGVVFLVLGSFLTLGALLEWRRERRLRAVGARTDGVVTRLRWSGGNAYPVFRFETPDGRTFEVEAQAGSSPPPFDSGAPVRVLYDPANPEHARIDRAAYGPGRIIWLVLIGLTFAAIGVWLLSTL